MRLILFRHGIAEERRPDLDDADRQLTPDGIERTGLAAQGLAFYLGEIDAILTSPKRRAVQTADLLSEATGVAYRISEPLATGTISQALSAVKRCGQSSVVLVGHEPQLSMIGERLCGVGAASFIELKKAGAVVLRLSRVDPATPENTPSASLEALLPPRVLRAIAAGA